MNRTSQRILKALGKALGITSNEPSHGDIRSQLCAQVEERFSGGKDPATGMVPYDEQPWVVEVYDKYLIYSLSGELYQINYTVDNKANTATLSEDNPIQVSRMTTYKPVSNEQGDSSMARLNPGDRTQIITNLKGDTVSPPNMPWRILSEDTLGKLADDTLIAYDETRKGLHLSNNNQPPADGFVAPDGNRHVYNPRTGTWTIYPPAPTQNQGGQVLPPHQPQMPQQLPQQPVIPPGYNPQQQGHVHNGNCGCPGVSNQGQGYAQQPQQQPQQNQNPNQQPQHQQPQQVVPVAQPVANTTAKPRNAQEWIAMMPPDAQPVWDMVNEQFNQIKSSMIERLTENMVGDAKAAAQQVYLNMDPKQLQALVAALPPRESNPAPQQPTNNAFSWIGASGAPLHNATVSEEPLLQPVYNFGRSTN